MLPWIIGAAVVGVGAYLLEDSKSENRSARREYNNEVAQSKSTLQSSFYNAQRKDRLDKLFKAKRAKRKIADAIYSELKNSRHHYSKVNAQLKASKYTLDTLFHQKKYADKADMKRSIQQNITIVVHTRKELFKVKDGISSNLNHLKVQLKEANMATVQIQESINHET